MQQKNKPIDHDEYQMSIKTFYIKNTQAKTYLSNGKITSDNIMPELTL